MSSSSSIDLTDTSELFINLQHTLDLFRAYEHSFRSKSHMLNPQQLDELLGNIDSMRLQTMCTENVLNRVKERVYREMRK